MTIEAEAEQLNDWLGGTRALPRFPSPLSRALADGHPGVNLFVQGMRRSGTTILYDALLEDPELRLFYEPLREEKVTVGGGSGARETDAFAETREIRAAFAAERFPEVPLEEFNWGGPREPRLEVEARAARARP